MKIKAREIISIDSKKLFSHLNKALADEWLAYYQYWIGAKVVEGPMRTAAVAELMQHAQQEFEHANMLADRIVQLGGTPLINPQEWYKQSVCGYKAPTNPFIKNILMQNLEAEQCAIGVYHELMNMLKDKDMVTYFMIEKILVDELHHEEDLQKLLVDLELIKKAVKNT